jgi:hypothetical protein
MSVTFYDKYDPPDFESNSNIGKWLNLSNGNAAAVLHFMGLNEDDPYGEMDGDTFRKCVHRAQETVKLTSVASKQYLLERYAFLMEIFSDTKTVKWE